MQYWEIAAESFFLSKNVLTTIAIALILLGSITFLTGVRKKRLNNKDDLETKDETARIAGFWTLTITLSGYFLVIVQISTGIVERYQLMIYPTGVLVMVTIIHYILKQIKKARGIWLLAAAYVLCCVWNYNFNAESIDYIYPGYKAAIQALNTEYRHVPGIYVTSGNYFVVHNSLFLSQQESTYPIQAYDLEKLAEACAERECGQLILYVDSYYDVESVVKQASELTGYSSCVLLYDGYLSRIFCLSR